MLLLLVFLLSSLSLLYLLPRIIKNKSRFNPPGPLGLPLIGNLHQIHQSSLHTSLWSLSKSYGPIISLHFGFIPTIVISSATLAKEVMKTQDLIFCDRPSTVAQRKLSYNCRDMVFSPYNHYWRMMRKMFTIHLSSSKRVQSSRYIREDEVSHAMNKIRRLALSSDHVNLSEIAKSVANSVITRVAFGKRYEDGPERREVVRRIDGLQAMITILFVSDLWPGLPFVGLIDRLTGKMGRLEKCFQDLDSFYQDLIDERHDSRNYAENHKEEDDYIIDILIQLKKDQVLNDVELTDDHIKAMLTDILVAGTDTSAATLVWAMTTLVKNPKVMTKVQEEVRKVVGKKDKVNEDDLLRLDYLKAVVKEVMRLYPPAPLLVPREMRNDAILHGYKIKKKTTIHVNALAIGRDPESWENPEEFLPERFLGSDIDFRGNHFELIPFGAGRRICPGISMGIMLVELLLANLVYFFDWGLPNDNVYASQPSTGRNLLQAKKPCPVNFESLNYTIITSSCKGPNYPADLCCQAFKEFACPYSDELNDLSNECLLVMFSYINLNGDYPPGLFSNLCHGDKVGLPCDTVPPGAAKGGLADDSSKSQVICNPFLQIIITTELMFLLFYGG